MLPLLYLEEVNVSNNGAPETLTSDSRFSSQVAISLRTVLLRRVAKHVLCGGVEIFLLPSNRAVCVGIPGIDVR